MAKRIELVIEFEDKIQEFEISEIIFNLIVDLIFKIGGISAGSLTDVEDNDVEKESS
jgi:hypothetical protein